MAKLLNNGDEKDVEKLSTSGYVALPFDENQFKEFVVGLLGKPQTISGYVDGAFEIELGDVKNLYSLINQRISQQNDAHLISFNANIVFSDKSSVLINSIEALLSYNEIKPIISREIHLTFLYLIRFRDRDVPEKQEINVSFMSSRDEKVEIERKGLDISVDPQLRRIQSKWREGIIQYTIKHTARTWGTDIEALLVNHFKGLLEPESRVTRFMREYADRFGIVVFFTILILTGFAGDYIKRSLRVERLKEVERVFDINNSENLETIISHLKYIASIDHSTFDMSWMVLLGFFIGAISLGFVSNGFSARKGSYILLTKESFKYKKLKNRQYERQWLKFIINIAVGISVSLVANYLFIYFN